MERRDPEMAGLLIFQSYEDNNSYMMQTLKKAVRRILTNQRLTVLTCAPRGSYCQNNFRLWLDWVEI